MTNPLISVVIPSFNHDRYIKNAIESVINQTYKNWELIIIDNNSIDNTDKILSCYNLPNFMVYKINNNGIIACSRNLGIKHSNGDWIAFLDSDDEWFNNKLQVCIDQIETNVDIIYHDMKIKNNNLSFFESKVIKGRSYKEPILIELLLNGSKINNSSVIVRKTILEQVGLISTENKIIASEDFHTWLKIANISNGFKYIPQILGTYTVHDAGISRKDMSHPMRNATIEFSRILDKGQINKLKAHIRYAHCRYVYSNSLNINITKQLLFCIKFGNFQIQIRSFYMISMFFFKKVLNFKC